MFEWGLSLTLFEKELGMPANCRARVTDVNAAGGSQMTSRERLLAVDRGEKPDRVPALAAFVDYLRTGHLPFPFAETVEIIKIIIAGIRSREQGGATVPLEMIQA